MLLRGELLDLGELELVERLEGKSLLVPLFMEDNQVEENSALWLGLGPKMTVLFLLLMCRLVI